MTEPTFPFPRSKVRHGTNSGWSKHVRDGERPCDPCYRAKQEYDRRRLETTPAGVKGRLRARAQSKALLALSHEYPDRFQALYEQAKREAGL